MTPDDWDRMSWHARSKWLHRQDRERQKQRLDVPAVLDEARRLQALITPDPPEVIQARRREIEAHEVSLVLELPPGHMAWCLQCSKPWPCPDADLTHNNNNEGTAA